MSRQRSGRGFTLGFTLMEVMIAVAVTGLIGGMVAVAFHTAFNAREVVEKDGEHYRMIRAATSRMSREIGAAYVSDRYDLRRYRDQNDRPTNFIGERDRLLFSSFAHQRLYADAKESDQMVVEYYVRRSEDRESRGRQDLVRRVKPIVQGRMDRDGSEDVLFEGIRGLELAYWDPERREWDDEWDTRRLERKAILPTRVRFTLKALDENGKEARYTTQTRIMLNTELPRF